MALIAEIRLPDHGGKTGDIERQIDSELGRRRQGTRKASLGTFSGYRIGLDIGDGNIGWCVLFEDGLRVRLLDAEAIRRHNDALAPGKPRIQLPDLATFVPAGTHKFENRDPETSRSLAGKRVDARAGRRRLDARQWRKFHVKRALREAGLLPPSGKPVKGHADMRPGELRRRIVEDGAAFGAHRHDLGRALLNTLTRRGWMPSVGRTGPAGEGAFTSEAEKKYRRALKDFDCPTVGVFLERCAEDARRDGQPFRRRYAAWGEPEGKAGGNGKGGRPSGQEDERPSYVRFRELAPTFPLTLEECRILRERSALKVKDALWERVEAAARHRRPLRGTVPGVCEHLPGESRCVAALPSYQRLRIHETASGLRTRNGRSMPGPLDSGDHARVIEILRNCPYITLAGLEHQIGIGLETEQGVDFRKIHGDRTGWIMKRAVGDAWGELDLDAQDRWVMRVLRRHAGAANEVPEAWGEDDEEGLRRDADQAFGEGALRRIDEAVWGLDGLEDRFSPVSVKAARILADCHERQAALADRHRELRSAGAREPTFRLYDSLPYYGAVLGEQTIPAELFAPRELLCEDELEHGRVRNPDVHLVLNRVRKVVNAIIDMMGGIPPRRCSVEMARSAMSETASEERGKRTRQRERAEDKIAKEIRAASESGQGLPRGTEFGKLLERWKAAKRQGWRDYDGSEIQPGALVDGEDYQLNHVEPAAFGDQRQDNLFVSRFNRLKGKKLPWEAFKNDDACRGVILAFARFGTEQRIAGLGAMLRGSRVDAMERERLRTKLEDAKSSLAALDKHGDPDPGVLKQIRTVPRQLATQGLEREADVRGLGRLFRKFHPDYKTESRYTGGVDPDAENFPRRDVAHSGWMAKLACRYLESIGVEALPIRSGAVHELRCMLGINKERADLRNHAVDAFIVGHFDSRVLKPALERVCHSHSFEDKFTPEPLWNALDGLKDGKGAHARQDLRDNLSCLGGLLSHVSTAHRPEHKWNPGDPLGAGLGEIGGQNLYAWRPKRSDRVKATAILKDMNEEDVDVPMKTKDILTAYENLDPDKQDEMKMLRKLRKLFKFTYRGRSGTVNIDTLTRTRDGGYVETSSKFALVSVIHAVRAKRRAEPLVAVLQSTDDARRKIFASGSIVYRRGDILVENGSAKVITGIRADGRLIHFPVNLAGRRQDDRTISVPRSETRKVKFDVLGRRLFALGRNTGDIAPTPYPLRV